MYLNGANRVGQPLRVTSKGDGDVHRECRTRMVGIAILSRSGSFPLRN
jgi:hypothetical protein